jgi:hypothetical protein
MTTRRSVYALVLALALVGTLAEAQNVGVGAFRESLPANAEVGALRGSVPASAGVGALGGSFPASTATGGLPGLSGPSGAFADSLAPNAPPAGLRGSVPPDATPGIIATGPFLNFGPATQEDVARNFEALAEVYLIDRSPSAKPALDAALTVRENSLGANSPGMAEALENQAALLRRYNREDQAGALEERARAIRKDLERPAPKR